MPDPNFFQTSYTRSELLFRTGCPLWFSWYMRSLSLNLASRHNLIMITLDENMVRHNTDSQLVLHKLHIGNFIRLLFINKLTLQIIGYISIWIDTATVVGIILCGTQNTHVWMSNWLQSQFSGGWVERILQTHDATLHKVYALDANSCTSCRWASIES